jgi:hypothetical protein
MDGEESDRRIYVGDCGCVRIETKHSRMTMQPTEFIDLLRLLVKHLPPPESVGSRLRIANHIRSNSKQSVSFADRQSES